MYKNIDIFVIFFYIIIYMKIKKWLNNNFKIVLLISTILSTIFIFILMLCVLINTSISPKPKSLNYIFEKSLNFMINNPPNQDIDPSSNSTFTIEMKTKITNYDYIFSGSDRFHIENHGYYTSTIELEYYYNNIYVLKPWFYSD